MRSLITCFVLWHLYLSSKAWLHTADQVARSKEEFGLKTAVDKKKRSIAQQNEFGIRLLTAFYIQVNCLCRLGVWGFPFLNFCE